MIENKFGAKPRAHVEYMASVKLKRRLLENEELSLSAPVDAKSDR